jgi:peptidase A4-like protein
VVGTWTQPTAVCSPGENSWSSPWVGIDGNASNTVEQIGTDTDCSNGQPFYYAWYEMYPKPLVFINTVPVTPGNSYTGEVTYASGTFTLKLTNNTTGQSFTTTQSSKKARRTSVEWVMEGPSSGLLTHFSTNSSNTIPFTAAAQSISGKTGNISTFTGGGSTNPQSITMVDSKGTTTRAQPTGITGGTSFNVNWLHG